MSDSGLAEKQVNSVGLLSNRLEEFMPGIDNCFYSISMNIHKTCKVKVKLM